MVFDIALEDACVCIIKIALHTHIPEKSKRMSASVFDDLSFILSSFHSFSPTSRSTPGAANRTANL